MKTRKASIVVEYHEWASSDYGYSAAAKEDAITATFSASGGRGEAINNVIAFLSHRLPEAKND